VTDIIARLAAVCCDKTLPISRKINRLQGDVAFSRAAASFSASCLPASSILRLLKPIGWNPPRCRAFIQSGHLEFLNGD